MRGSEESRELKESRKQKGNSSEESRGMKRASFLLGEQSELSTREGAAKIQI